MRMRLFTIYIIFLVSLCPASIRAENQVDTLTLQRDELGAYALLPGEQIFIHQTKLDELMNMVESQVAKEPQSATLGQDLTVIPEQLGVTLERDKFIEKFLKSYYQRETTIIEIPTKQVFPRVTKEMFQELTENKLGSFTTFFNPNNEERTKNIILSAEAIHGTVIFPGEKFSFNEVVGERTEEKGYQRATVIVKGEFAEDIGGGICQVSSTLFNAVDLRGIQMIERYTHSRSVPYVPPGRDATVSWWGPDFSFKNLYNEPIVITTAVTKGSLVVEVFSATTVEYFNEQK